MPHAPHEVEKGVSDNSLDSVGTEQSSNERRSKTVRIAHGGFREDLSQLDVPRLAGGA
jgi:hypothetical protein